MAYVIVKKTPSCLLDCPPPLHSISDYTSENLFVILQINQQSRWSWSMAKMPTFTARVPIAISKSSEYYSKKKTKPKHVHRRTLSVASLKRVRENKIVYFGRTWVTFYQPDHGKIKHGAKIKTITGNLNWRSIMNVRKHPEVCFLRLFSMMGGNWMAEMPFTYNQKVYMFVYIV